jgi:hypothetical protein
VTIEVILLGLASTVRPTSLAAVYALLSASAPRRLMTVYLAAGLAFTIAFGLLVIWPFSGIDLGAGSDRTIAIAEIAGGLVAIGFAVGVRTGRIRARRTGDAPDLGGRWKALLERRLTVRTAAVAGPATHIPGLFYLIALNLIAAREANVFGGLAEVLVYNAIWFAIPICALALCVVRPAAARDAVGAITSWTRLRARRIVIAASFAVGTVLVVRGVLYLL